MELEPALDYPNQGAGQHCLNHYLSNGRNASLLTKLEHICLEMQGNGVKQSAAQIGLAGVNRQNRPGSRKSSKPNIPSPWQQIPSWLIPQNWTESTLKPGFMVLNIRKNAGRPDYTLDLCYCWLNPCLVQAVMHNMQMIISILLGSWYLDGPMELIENIVIWYSGLITHLYPPLPN